MPDSVHTARWINQVADLGWDLHLFSSSPGIPHSDLRNITVYNISFSRPKTLNRSVRLRGLWPLRIGVERLNLKVSSSRWLAQIIRRLKPDVIHSMEIQRAGYITLEAKEQFKGRFPPWIVSNWGSDICLFGRLAAHAEKIRAVMSQCEYYHCECHRDVRLARDFGFRGETLPVFPVTGGFDLEWMRGMRQPGPTSARRTIALKGYQNWAGRALVGLRAIERCADALTGYSVVVYIASPEVKLAAELVSQSTGVKFEFETTDWKREDILRLHGRSRISIGLSISDAISTSLLEAMIMGSFPIQSNTGCGNEWLQDGETGILVHPEEPEAIAAAIRRAIAEDELVDRAAANNSRVADERLDYSIIQPNVIKMYQTILGTGVEGAKPFEPARHWGSAE
jgi:glycosyltransferase involved in cell wall biosynthesis